MSDSMRKGLGEQASEKSKRLQPHSPLHSCTNILAVTPDSSKSTTQKASENVSGLGDKAASAVQPGTSPSLPPPLTSPELY
jgi:hypothetical protein